jgi:hypothetical protein
MKKESSLKNSLDTDPEFGQLKRQIASMQQYQRIQPVDYGQKEKDHRQF